MCIWRNSSYESEDFAPSILHKLAIIELPVHTLAAYIVLFKTPSRMSSVKGMMLLMHFCGAYLDLFISALSTQYFLLPAAAGHSQGLYTYFGIPVKWQAYLYISGLCLAGTSVLSFFENRFTAVVRGKRSSLLHEKRRLWYIVGNYIFAFVCILPITFTPPEQSVGKAYVRDILPCVPQEILDHPDFFVYATDVTLLSSIISFAAVTICGQCIYFFVRIILYLSSKKAKSQKTYNLQLHFFIALSIQIFTPVALIIGPICYIVFAFVASHFDQALNNIFLNIIAIHGLMSGIVMLSVHTPYREAILKMICCGHTPKESNKNSVHTDGTIVVLSGHRRSILIS
ncbi:hypothetical protein CRE_07831 [Caenorhabditis remanei]|uniref:Serpentine Receptor, class H n=1 Tax=Caenorhabditis remanei TaxID=31234 RepID=E3NEK4_CAERE|nr:hypothetical protein CRE_07831 [Caenorhabditis remanei]